MTIISCQKDDAIHTPSEIATEPNDATFLQNFGTTITTNFIGKIVSVNGAKLKDVQITIDGQTTMTDHNGVFVLNNVSVYEKFAFVKANKQGYINGSRAVVPTPNGSNDIQITLLEKNIVGMVSSGSESEVTMPNGSTVNFQGDFIDASGNPYSGQVEVSMHYLEPNQEVTFTQMPGMLLAQDASNNPKVLETYGMLGINLFLPSGEQLNITENAPATLEFPVAISTPNAPETIALWYFDETVGYWKEQGEAIKVGNKYVAEVTHFSWWNCDLPLDYVNVCFNLRSHAELANYYVEIIRNENNQIIFSGYTNTEGEECGMFPANEEVTIKVYTDCLVSVLYDQVEGPFSTDTLIEVIVPPSSDITETQIQATFNDCNGNSIINGYAIIVDEDNQNSFSNEEGVSIIDGQFNYNVTHCIGANYNLIVYDYSSGTSTELITLTLEGDDLDLGIISTCTNTGGVFVGDVELTTQEEVDNFGLLGFSGITGNLMIGNQDSDNISITSLQSLNELTEVIGNLGIANTIELNSLMGLENLVSIDGMFSLSNTAISTLTELSSLEQITKAIGISENPFLVSLSGLEGVTYLEGELFESILIIRSNDMLTSLSGLENLISVGYGVIIDRNQSLTSLSGLENLNAVSALQIGLDIDPISGANPNLSDYCALANLVANGTYDNIQIENNAYNPTIQDIINGNCAQ